jgi:hypothetical protein
VQHRICPTLFVLSASWASEVRVLERFPLVE